MAGVCLMAYQHSLRRNEQAKRMMQMRDQPAEKRQEVGVQEP